MKFKKFTLDNFQEDSINAIENNYSVVVSAPTGSGKTLIADFIIDKHKDDEKRIIYTAPIKALSNQKYKDFSAEYGENKVGLMTGDIVINPDAKILIMTTEIYRNMVISNDEDIKNIAYVIFDEIHYINNIERGYVWEESIIYSSETVRFLCLSATIPNAAEFSSWIQAIKKHPVKTITATKRNVPLQQSFYDVELGITTLEKIKSAKEIPNYYHVMRSRDKKQKKARMPPPNHLEMIKSLGEDKLPCLFFHFSRHACQQKAQELARKNMFNKNTEIIKIIHDKLGEAPSDIGKLDTTRIMKETLPQGIGFHHAGLLPVLKNLVEELFSLGLIKVLYVTETFAVGINMPAKTVCFDSLRKFDGVNFRNLNTKEFFQIAGRAGRRGIDTIGYVVVMIYRPTFRYNEVKAITTKDVEPIKSQFRLSTNTVLNLINQHTEQEIEHILRLSFYSFQKFGQDYAKVPTKVLLSRYYSIVRKLVKYSYVRNNHVNEDINTKLNENKDRKNKIKIQNKSKNKNFVAKEIIANELTEKGVFSAKIFADEITIGEIFATEFSQDLDEYQILLLLTALAYEHRTNNEFKKEFKNEQLAKLWKKINADEYLAKEKKFQYLSKVTIFIYPIYHGKSFFEVLQLTNLLEGDLIRIYAQTLDRIGQIKKASTDYVLLNKLKNCQGIIKKALEGIYLV